MTIFLDDIQIDDTVFFDGFNWGNFDAGDKVFVEDWDNPRVDGLVFVFFELARGGAVWLTTPKSN